MATRRYSISPGDQLEGSARVTEAVGAATVTKCIEFTFDLANVKDGNTKPLSKLDVLLSLDTIRDYIVQGQWPPA